MSSSTKVKSKKKKDASKAAKAQKTCVEVLPAVVSRKFGANEFVGTIKEGSFGCQHLEGPAKYVWSSGTTYEGSMTSSVIEGRGKFCWPDGSTYEGELQEGKRHGQGTYVAKDGVTRYEGQWASGKRHGYGKLVYSADGTSFYDGQWAGGKKHGRGKQVWPSGNCYDGEWDSGSMRGQGTMSWTTVAGQEMYSGSWEENNPHGEGTHTWCTPAEPASPRGLNDSVASFGMGGTRRPAAAPAPQQQQVNRYAGQWQGGSRSGFGTFYYANGANYAGEWKDHVKHGRGRHTLEDGRSYESDFVGDRPLGGPRELLEGDSSAKGAAENPVGKIIEVPDLFPLALPSDQSGFPATVGTGYQDPVKVLREVHNGLLRHLSTMRDLYKSYRLLAPTPGEDQDPFVMRTYQLWALARDAGLVTPGLPLAHLDRAVFSGPRHRREANPEAEDEVRPLTPPPIILSPLNELPAADQAADEVARSSAGSRRSRRTQPPGSQAEGDAEEEEEPGDSAIGSDSESAASRPGSVAASRAVADEDAEGGADAEALAVAEAAAAAEAKALREFVPPQGAFLRPEGVVDIHLPSRQLLFRHFLEAAARLSPVCFRRERGLESQVLRLLTEHVAPLASRPEPSDCVFAFLVEEEFQAVLGEFGPALRGVFRGASRQADLHEGADEEACSRPKDFGAVRRQFHVGARLDQTVRLKDVLRLLADNGMLLPMLFSSAPLGDGTSERVLPEPAAAEDHDGLAPVEALAPTPPVETLLKAELEATDPAASGGERGAKSRSATSGGEESSLQEQLLEAAAAAGAQEAAEPSPPPTLEQDPTMASCDFSLTAVEVMRIVAEVMSPESVGALRWQLPGPGCPLPEDCGAAELVPVLEFLEGELIFPEFLRLLIKVADYGSRSNSVLSEAALASRFECFMRHVFLPSLQAPYASPRLRRERAAEAAAAASEQAAPEAAAEQQAAQPSEPAPQEDEEKEDKKKGAKGADKKKDKGTDKAKSKDTKAARPASPRRRPPRRSPPRRRTRRPRSLWSRAG